MAKSTINVADEDLERIPIRAPRENSAGDAKLGQSLSDDDRADAARRRRYEALDALLSLANECRSGRAGQTWTREDLYEQ